MQLLVYTADPNFVSFLNEQLEPPFVTLSQIDLESPDEDRIHVLHLSSLQSDGWAWLKRYASVDGIRSVVCSDRPALVEMLECARLGARAYCNSHMAAAHYDQLLQLVENGQSWYPPHMLEETFRLAHKAAQETPSQADLAELTGREKEIALAVADGKSNRQIADQLQITEPTVKTHLTHIFRKLEVQDRVGLVLYIKQA